MVQNVSFWGWLTGPSEAYTYQFVQALPPFVNWKA